MDALLTAFLGAALAEFGDKTQLLVIALAAHCARVRTILAGVLVAALLNASIAAAGGALLRETVSVHAISLLLALALVFAGVTGLLRVEPPKARLHHGVFLAAAGGAFFFEFGDKTQFLTAALAAHYGAFVLTVIGAAMGVTAASVPAALLGERLSNAVSLRGVRIGSSLLLLLAGLVVGLKASQLV